MLKVNGMHSLQDWHIPLHQDSMTLEDALSSIPTRTANTETTLMLRLQHDPDLSFLGQLVFRAGIDQHQHDCIHILLGRGMLAMDQAFVLGFTIASSKKATLPEQRLVAEIGRHFNRQRPLLNEAENNVFREAVKLAYMSFCAPLEDFDFQPWATRSLRDLREAIGLEPELLLAYYAIERHRFPHSPASQRLLPHPAQAAGI